MEKLVNKFWFTGIAEGPVLDLVRFVTAILLVLAALRTIVFLWQASDVLKPRETIRLATVPLGSLLLAAYAFGQFLWDARAFEVNRVVLFSGLIFLSFGTSWMASWIVGIVRAHRVPEAEQNRRATDQLEVA